MSEKPPSQSSPQPGEDDSAETNADVAPVIADTDAPAAGPTAASGFEDEPTMASDVDDGPTAASGGDDEETAASRVNDEPNSDQTSQEGPSLLDSPTEPLLLAEGVGQTGGEPTLDLSGMKPGELFGVEKAASRSRGRELVSLVVRYGKEQMPESAPRTEKPDTGPPKMVGRIGQLIPYLQTIPWLLGVVFVVSFFWDFPDASFTVFGTVVPAAGLLRVLSVSGLIGFLTNWVAITMLFQPRAKRAIVPQGLIPAQRERVIYQLSSAISRELINAEIIKQKIQESGVIGRYRDLALGVVRGVVENPDFRSELKGMASDYAKDVLGSETFRKELAKMAVEKVEEQAGQGLGGVALRLYRTFAEDDFQRRVDKALAELPDAILPLLDRIDAALDIIPEKVEARADEIEEIATKAVLSFVESFDVKAMIMEKARTFDESQLENLLKSTSNEQLNYIKYLGGILGVFGGLVIWRAEMLVVFVVIGLLLWGLDEALVRARNAGSI